MGCKTNVDLVRNSLIEKSLIWPNLARLYDAGSLSGLKSASAIQSYISVNKDITFRTIHLQSRLATYKTVLERRQLDSSDAEEISKDVRRFCEHIEEISVQLQTIFKKIQALNVHVPTIVKNYQKDLKNFHKTCNALEFIAKQVNGDDTTQSIDTSAKRMEYLKEKYRMQALSQLPSDDSVASIDEVLRDILFRRDCLANQYQFLTREICHETLSTATYAEKVKEAKNMLDTMNKIVEKLRALMKNCSSIKSHVEEYLSLLKDPRQPDIACSRFIYLFETLRWETERLEIVEGFPKTSQLMQKWQKDFGVGDEFQPKVFDLCQAIKSDLKELLDDQKCIYTVPYRVGVIGHQSVGKTALITRLVGRADYMRMVNLERSTFGYLQFDTYLEHPKSNGKGIPVSFIDIAGAIDNDTTVAVGNFIDLIHRSDCDAYILVFDRPFDALNQTWFDEITVNLKRRCLLVHSRSDYTFKEFYRETALRDFQPDSYDSFSAQSAVETTRQHASKRLDGRNLERKIYLTGINADSEFQRCPFGQFDFDQLKRQLCQSASIDMRVQRVCRLAIAAAKTVLNTCFRRGYVVSKIKYRCGAAAASIIPFLDELVAFLGREQIRQAFGIHDQSSIVNSVQGKVNSLEAFLSRHYFVVPNNVLKSGYFKYLLPKERKSTHSCRVQPTTDDCESRNKALIAQATPRNKFFRNHVTGQTSNTIGRLAMGAGITASVLDETLSIAAPAAIGALRGVSTAGIVVGAVLAPAYAAWAFYSSGKRMNSHLHKLCDDVQVVLIYFIAQVCNDCAPVNSDSFSSDSDED